MNQTLLSSFGTPFERVENALAALREGRGVMVLDDEDRENEGDMIFAAETMTVEQMALTIRHGRVLFACASLKIAVNNLICQ